MMAYNRGTRHRPKWAGHAEYKGRKKWVGTFATKEEYREAAERCRAELRAEVDHAPARKAPTVLEFAGAEIDADTGRITMTWPDGQRCQKEKGRKRSSVERMRDGLRQFVREHGDRPLDSFTRTEALTWVRPRGAHVQQSVRQFFNHALDHDLIATNQFVRIGASKRKRRVDRHDFEIISDEQYAKLRQCARASRADDYGLVLEGAVLAVGEAAVRPGEVFALHRDEVDFAENAIHVCWQLDSKTGKRVSPKDDDGRWVVMSPAFRDHLERMPGHYSDVILFPTVRGAYMRQPNWAYYWHAVRASAGMPGQEFYELKHRAIQWMVDPVEDGGLGLDPATVAEMVGHDDGGYLISTVYTKLAQRRALARAQRAMGDYRQRQAESARHLHVVGAR
jgi:integrase